jgi:hypothetical protein
MVADCVALLVAEFQGVDKLSQKNAKAIDQAGEIKQVRYEVNENV